MCTTKVLASLGHLGPYGVTLHPCLPVASHWACRAVPQISLLLHNPQMEKWHLKRIYSGGSRVIHENKAFELLHINWSVSEKAFYLVSEPDFEKPVGRVVWKRMLWAAGRNRGHFEWRGGRIALAQLERPRGRDVNKHSRDTESLFGKDGRWGSRVQAVPPSWCTGEGKCLR